MKQSLEIKLGQRLTMTPQLQQAIRLLQLSAIDLKTEIQQALEQNPLLEEPDEGVEERTSGVDREGEIDANGSSDSGESNMADTDIAIGADTPVADESDPSDWEEQFELPYTSRVRNSSESVTFELDGRNSKPATLREHLHWQMCMTPFSVTDRVIAITIIDAIDEDGYLGASVEDIANLITTDEMEVDAQEVVATLHQIQNFEPVGVGARDLQECLLIQLRQFDPSAAEIINAQEIIKRHFQLLGNRDYAQLKKAMQLDDDALNVAIKLIQNLHPRPGNGIAPAQPNYIIPDIIVKKIKGEWRAELNPDTISRLAVSDTYKRVINRCHNNSEKRYVRDQLQEARWFIKSLHNRNETLLEVARAIIERQQEFLDHGEQAMKPMILHHIAKKLDVHESTISRATTQKYMLTPRGIFELKYFFSSHVSTADGGTCSSTAIRSLIKTFIETEPPSKPISDNQIAKLLEGKGINVARRTVAKYREHLNIPPSSQRKPLR